LIRKLTAYRSILTSVSITSATILVFLNTTLAVTSSSYLPHASHNANLSPGTSSIYCPLHPSTPTFTPTSIRASTKSHAQASRRRAHINFTSTSGGFCAVIRLVHALFTECSLRIDNEREYAQVGISIKCYILHPHMNATSTTSSHSSSPLTGNAMRKRCEKKRVLLENPYFNHSTRHRPRRHLVLGWMDFDSYFGVLPSSGDPVKSGYVSTIRWMLERT